MRRSPEPEPEPEPRYSTVECEGGGGEDSIFWIKTYKYARWILSGQILKINSAFQPYFVKRPHNFYHPTELGMIFFYIYSFRQIIYQYIIKSLVLPMLSFLVFCSMITECMKYGECCQLLANLLSG